MLDTKSKNTTTEEAMQDASSSKDKHSVPRMLNRSLSTKKLKLQKSKRKKQNNSPELYVVSSPVKSPRKKKIRPQAPTPEEQEKLDRNMAVFEMLSNGNGKNTQSSPKRRSLKKVNSDRVMDTGETKSNKLTPGTKSNLNSSMNKVNTSLTSSPRRKMRPSASFRVNNNRSQVPEQGSIKASMSQRSLLSSSASWGDLTSLNSSRAKLVDIHPSSSPMSLVSLLKRHAAAKVRGGSTGPCLKRRSSRASGNEYKSVKFATNSYNDQVWGLVKPIDHHHDIINLNDYWWSEEEMDEIRDEILELAASVEVPYGETLHRAYVSTFEYVEESPEAVDLNFDLVSQFADARGLEAAVARAIVIEVKDTHRHAVLGTQASLRQQKGSKQYAFDDSDLRLLRKKAEKSSRCSRLVATKMGFFDRHAAVVTL